MIKLTFHRAKDMANDIATNIEQHPTRVRLALSMCDMYSDFAKFIIDGIGDRPYLPWVRCGADHEVIGDDREFANIEQDDIGSLLVYGCIDGMSCAF